MDVLHHMRLFVEVAKRKSFRAAADALDMSNSTLSRNIAELEKKIGLRLLHRSTRKVELTDAGEAYFKRCQGIVEEALNAHEALLDWSERPAGILRVTMTSSFGVGYLAPVMQEFADMYPAIKFDFDVSTRAVDLQSEPFDLAIRMGTPPTAPSTLVVRRIAMVPRYMYASPHYVARMPPLEHAGDLQQHVMCGSSFAGRPTDIWRKMYRGDEVVEVQAQARYVTNSASLAMSLAANGLCIAALDPLMARQEVQVGRLQRVLCDWHMEPVQVHALTETRHLPARTRLFIDFLRQRLANA